ncbi:MAG: 5'-methylthioadenosine/adenosylhomocysteine nucleosidase [Epsilonproteobacteria bacterium]|nr:5'-methylthioadenosine/adenosylhomocysteine nucleosidase [Campylobacterota bacterium]
MNIAIMGAMVEEITPILERVTLKETIEYAKNKYYLASYKQHNLVIAYSKIGKVHSALTASIMLEKFKAEKLLFSGVAGAINEQLHIGDLIIATKLCQHDLDISAFGHPYGYVPESKIYVETSSTLNNIAKKVADKLNINLLEGIIATGDQFINDTQKKQWIKDTFNADAIEMEGASVGFVCDAFGVEFFVLRAISDSADMDAGFDFDKFLETSAQNSADFLIKMLDYIDE